MKIEIKIKKEIKQELIFLKKKKHQTVYLFIFNI